MTDPIRKAFEEVTYLSLRATGHGLRRNLKGEYVSDSLEDHWQTFQEVFEMIDDEQFEIYPPVLQRVKKRFGIELEGIE